MSELIDKHTVDDGLYIYLQSNSEVWIARFKIGGKWISRTTKQRERSKAATAAIKVRAECEIKHEHGIAIQTGGVDPHMATVGEVHRPAHR